MRERSELLKRVASMGVLTAAWEKVRQRGSGPGIDRVTVKDFEQNLSEELEGLHRMILSGDYRPMPARRIWLPDDPDRQICVPTVLDRVVQRALCDVLAPRYEATFSDNSHAYRPGRSVKTAIRAAERHLARGLRWFVRTDIEKFFDKINRERLLEMLAEDGIAADVRRLIGKTLRAGALQGAVVYDSGTGVPQGSALSPLLSNIYLRSVDRRLEMDGVCVVRYADDFLILGRTSQVVNEGLDALAVAVESLGLGLNLRKTLRGHVGAGFGFLGAHFDASGQRFSQRALEALERRAAELAAKAQAADPAPLAGLMDAWTQWYGQPQIRTLPVLTGCVVMHLARNQGIDGLAATRVSLHIPEGEPTWLYRVLVRAWDRAATEAADRALVLDAVAAARAAGDDAEQQRSLARALALPTAVIKALAGPVDALASVWASAGCARWAKATRWLRAAKRRQDTSQSTTSSTGPGWSRAQRQRFLEWFQGQERLHILEQRDPRGHTRPIPQQGPLDDADFKAHLQGGPRCGVYMVRGDGTVTFSVLDMGVHRAHWERAGAVGPDGNRRAEMLAAVQDCAARMARRAREYGWPCAFEDTGRGGRRLWFFYQEPVPIHVAHGMMRRLLNSLGEMGQWLWVRSLPTTDRPTTQPGPYAILPYGGGRQGYNRSVFLDASGRSLDEPWEALEKVPAAAVEQELGRWKIHGVRWDEAESEVVGRLAGMTQVAPIMRGCAVLRRLAAKARRLGHLEGLERASMFEVLGHVPSRAQGESALRSVLKAADAVEHRRIHRRLGRLSDAPIGCAKLRQRHAEVAVEVGCACRFGALPQGVWPSPLLHGCAPGDVGAMRQAMASSQRRVRRRPQINRHLVEDHLVRLARLDEHLQGVKASMARSCEALAAELDRVGVKKVSVEAGWLERMPNQEPPVRLIKQTAGGVGGVEL